MVNPGAFSSMRVRRANVDDLPILKRLWEEMRLNPDTLESRLTEFQVVENLESEVLGTIGILIQNQHALLHSEGYSDFSVADPARDLFWDRIQTLASNHGVFRLWTREQSPFWKKFGFHPANPEVLARLPASWQDEEPGIWLTHELKDETQINAALARHSDQLQAQEAIQLESISKKVRSLNLFITIAGFTIGVVGIAWAVYLMIHRNPFAGR